MRIKARQLSVVDFAATFQKVVCKYVPRVATSPVRFRFLAEIFGVGFVNADLNMFWQNLCNVLEQSSMCTFKMYLPRIIWSEVK